MVPSTRTRFQPKLTNGSHDDTSTEESFHTNSTVNRHTRFGDYEYSSNDVENGNLIRTQLLLPHTAHDSEEKDVQ